ncbi:hypothetical protein LCGC14_0930560, partial [marine sediment metagenome]
FFILLGLILSFLLNPFYIIIMGISAIIELISEKLIIPKIEEQNSKGDDEQKESTFLMTTDRITNILETTHPNTWSYNDSQGIYTYKKDVDLTIRIKEDIKGNWEEFEEDWVTRFPDPEAKRIIARVYYRASIINDYLFVLVDGGRYIIAPPRTHVDLRISTFQYNLGRLLSCNYTHYEDNNLGQYDYKISQANISIDNNH